MIDPALVTALTTIIVAVLVNVPAWFISRATLRKMRSDQEAAVLTAKNVAANETDRLEREITERVLASSNAELDRQQKRINDQQTQIDRMQSKLIDKDVEMAQMRRGFQEQIDKLAEMVRQLLKQLNDAGHVPTIDLTEFKSIEAKYR